MVITSEWSVEFDFSEEGAKAAAPEPKEKDTKKKGTKSGRPTSQKKKK